MENYTTKMNIWNRLVLLILNNQIELPFLGEALS